MKTYIGLSAVVLLATVAVYYVMDNYRSTTALTITEFDLQHHDLEMAVDLHTKDVIAINLGMRNSMLVKS